MFDLREKSVVVTGASQGLGRALALNLAAQGAKLALVARHQNKLDQVVNEIRAQGGTAYSVVADVGEKESIYPIVGQATALAGPIDVLINNASTLGPVPLRLVLDTGIHSKRWSRDQAIKYMTENTLLSERDITKEVNRYIANPGQATSYMVGQLKMFEVRENLVAKVRMAAGASLASLRAEPPPATLAPAGRFAASGRFDVVVVGISTGGPHALRHMIPQLPVTCPVPVVVVLHMPVGYTSMYAERLDDVSPLAVREAREGAEVRQGVVLIARAGLHLTFRREPSGRVVAHLDERPHGRIFRPSVDVLFQSAAETYGSRVLGVVMTGMGDDGRQGAAWIKAKGGLIFTEAEETCIVYGMPGAVVEAGLSDRSIALGDMARSILEEV